MSASAPSRETIARQYDGWAAVYDWIWRGYVDRTLGVLEAWAALRPGERVLDVGCGTGAFEARAVASGASNEMVGVDLSARMLARAREKLAGHPQVAFRRADAHALPFDDGRFDVVVSASAFHYFADPARALAEIGRVLRPGGRLVVLDWCRDFWTCRLLDRVLAVVDPAYRRCLTLAEMQALVAGAPLVVRRAERLRVGWFWGMMAIEALRPEEGRSVLRGENKPG